MPQPHERTELEAATFRRLLQHLDEHKEVQNIDLMILADFCRNCLGKWYGKAAEDLGIEIGAEEARDNFSMILAGPGRFLPVAHCS